MTVRIFYLDWYPIQKALSRVWLSTEVWHFMSCCFHVVWHVGAYRGGAIKVAVGFQLMVNNVHVTDYVHVSVLLCSFYSLCTVELWSS